MTTDGRLNVSAGLAAYISSVVKTELAIQDKKNDIPTYALYAYNVTKPNYTQAHDIYINNEPLDVAINQIENRIVVLETTEQNFISKSDLDLYKSEVQTKLDDKANKSDLDNKVSSLDFTTYQGEVSIALDAKLDTKTFDKYKEATDKAISKLQEDLAALTIRVGTLEEKIGI